ncbi:SCP-2 sterol transfer family protein [Pseudanabaena galeata UHCC 0370]|uniref:SCP-2 sterol transfer family protein n=1 Tax=Pseudanabaena galeata UHCC 0370 TaxID=3110310 RepID=A0ABU5TIY2_9CYAN|nr:SCP-2 sterol transfer family protein [Pseudanabaena galeata]MEA5478267.1 SCP-2 sterol transfer family protein [Pseudanabaena galeata UHCC 0370]
MADLFSQEWMETFGSLWNADAQIVDSLAKIHFNSTIGYGFEGDEQPKGVIVVQEGKVTSAGTYAGQVLNWDLRADRLHWQKWTSKGLDMMGLSMAYMSRKLQFRVGDYTAMIKDPRMASPFIKSFSVMSRV